MELLMVVPRWGEDKVKEVEIDLDYDDDSDEIIYI